MNSNDLHDICTVIKLRQAALKRKKKEIAARIYKQQTLFPEQSEKKEMFVCGTLFDVKMDISEGNLKSIFSPYTNEIQGLQKSFFYLQNLKGKIEEAEKLQKVLF